MSNEKEQKLIDLIGDLLEDLEEHDCDNVDEYRKIAEEIANE